MTLLLVALLARAEVAVPSLTARKVVRALKRAGFIEDRQKGSHLILIQPTTKARTVVPIHSGKTH